MKTLHAGGVPFALLDFVFPRHSLLGDEGALVTEREIRLLRSTPVIFEQAQLRHAGLQFIDRIVAAADYEKTPLLKNAVHTFKYKRVRGVGEALGGMVVGASFLLKGAFAEGSISLPSPLRPSPTSTSLCSVRGRGELPALVPVPLHWTRKFSRGFNQSSDLGAIVSRERGWPLIELLRRTRPTGHQARRKRVERFEGVRDAFAVRLRIGLPEHVILVDDLSTTGATMDMCAKALKQEGVQRVEGLVVAMG